ncbi:MAG: Uma2 family endonuclease [Prosthecobacter sp.]|uniref:Uma2 family endonuclease n=1 Tax=Prosthecobacter sp. TaxID=1965333 RepID=UPI003903DEC7
MPVATLPAPKVSRRRAHTTARHGGHVSLPFPKPSPGQTVMVGLGDWDSYLNLDQLCEKRGMRVRFHRGIIEIMSISFPHESLKFAIGRMVTAWCDSHEIDYNAWGSTTQRVEGVMGGEPDNSFSFGAELKAQPDLFIEVALSSGGIDKLEFWSEIKAAEVWIWQNQKLHAFVLSGEGYQPVKTSQVLPGIDLKLIEELAELKPHSKAIREFQQRSVRKE